MTRLPSIATVTQKDNPSTDPEGKLSIQLQTQHSTAYPEFNEYSNIYGEMSSPFTTQTMVMLEQT